MVIAVMGATGNTGRVVADLCLAAGARVRVLGRSRERLAPFVERGAEAAVGEARDPEYLARAFRGADAVYALVPANYGEPDPQGYYDAVGSAIATAVREAGVPCVVLLSSVGADQASGAGPISLLHAQEERLRAIPGLRLLLLRPGYFFENFFGSLPVIRQHGVNGGAIAPDVALPMIAARDIGAVAAEALRAPDGAGVEVRELLGPRDLTMREATRILGAALGRPDLAYVQLGADAVVSGLTATGFSRAFAELLVEMAQAMNEGRVRSLQGRTERTATPTTFESFVPVLADAYRRM